MDPNELRRIAHDPEALRWSISFVRQVNDPYLAADLTADVFLVAIDAAASYRPERGAPDAWLFGVARNVVAAEHRRAARERRANARVEGRRLLDENDIERMQQRIDAAAQARVLFAAVAQLPDGERAVLELVALDDLSVTEAAAVLGLRAVTAQVRLHRARRGAGANSSMTTRPPSPIHWRHHDPDPVRGPPARRAPRDRRLASDPRGGRETAGGARRGCCSAPPRRR